MHARQTSHRVKQIDAPIIVKTQKLTASAKGVVSLAQGRAWHCTCISKCCINDWLCPSALPAGPTQTRVLGSVIGTVHWNPPQQATDAVVASAGDHSLNQYGSGAGLPDLVKALEHKLATENGITQVTTLHAK